jgi:WD40 repeat protein
MMISPVGQTVFVNIQIPDKAIPTTVQFSTSGRLVGVNFEDRSVRVFDSNTGKTTLILRGHDDQMLLLAFSADDRLLLGIGEVRSRVWSVPAGERIAVLPVAIRGDSIHAAAFSPDARSLAFLDSNRLLIWQCAGCAGKDALLAELKRHQVTRTPTQDEKDRYGLKAHDHGDTHVATAQPAPVVGSTTGSKPH